MGRLSLVQVCRRNPDVNSPGRIAGIDFGEVRIGIAITDPGQTIASPFENYPRSDQTADALRFQQLVEQENVVRFVVGLPIHTSGEESPQSRAARAFGAWLAQVTGIPVDFFDERFSTKQAEQLLQSAQLTSRQRKQRRDMVAAQILLTAYLETGRERAPEIGPLDG